MLTYSLMVSLAACPQGPREQSPQFHTPVRLQADGKFIKTEAPGYAAPCWFDLDGDGNKDLIVGQFAGGKMQVFRNESSRNESARNDGLAKDHGPVPRLMPTKDQWLMAEGDIAEVPGVW